MKWHPPSHEEQSECQVTAEADKDIISAFGEKIKEVDKMQQIKNLYEAYCAEHIQDPMTKETMRLLEGLAEMLPHKEYLEVEEFIGASQDERDKKFFVAGFRVAASLWGEAMK